MNRPEAAQVCATIAAAYPWDLADEQIDVWYDAALRDVTLDLGLEVAIRIVETDERFPTPARFNDVRSAVERERYLSEREEHRQESLPGVPTSADVRRHALDRMRASLSTLAKGGTRGHWHGGPDPCPVCGGINPAVLVAAGPEERRRLELAIEVIKADQRARLGV